MAGNQELEITSGKGGVTAREPDHRGQAGLRMQGGEDHIMGSVTLTTGP